MYVAWERELARRLAALRLPRDLADEYVQRTIRTLVAALTEPSGVWFDGGGVEQCRLEISPPLAAIGRPEGLHYDCCRVNLQVAHRGTSTSVDCAFA